MNLACPYLSESGGHSNATWEAIFAYLDRAYAVGTRVNYQLIGYESLPNDQATLDQLAEVKCFSHYLLQGPLFSCRKTFSHLNILFL
jgi:hypothetical protein